MRLVRRAVCRQSSVIVSVVSAVFAAALVASVSESAAQGSTPSGEIAYVATKSKVYAVNADGTGRRPLLSGVAMDTFNWSYDGRLIAYTAGPWGQAGDLVRTVVRIAQADGTVVRTLPRGRLDAIAEPAWSPDGTRLAFVGWDESADTLSIYVMSADGVGARRLTRSSLQYDESPDWSPDGRWIMFERYGSGPRTDVMAVRPDGSGLRRIATVITGPQCACPDWSPDGSKIAYQASPTLGRHPEIFVMNANGMNRTRRTHHRSRDENPDWSPDGQWIAFYSERNGNGEIYVVGADGTRLMRVTRDPWYSMFPRWRPNG